MTLNDLKRVFIDIKMSSAQQSEGIVDIDGLPTQGDEKNTDLSGIPPQQEKDKLIGVNIGAIPG